MTGEAPLEVFLNFPPIFLSEAVCKVFKKRMLLGVWNHSIVMEEQYRNGVA
jgi:hypothetical protein